MKILTTYTSTENLILIYLFSISLITFLVFGIDKRKAKSKKWRISENILLFLSLIGGATGALIGMVVFKHKLSKGKFYIGIPILIGLNRIMLFWVLNNIR